MDFSLDDLFPKRVPTPPDLRDRLNRRLGGGEWMALNDALLDPRRPRDRAQQGQEGGARRPSTISRQARREGFELRGYCRECVRRQLGHR